MEFVWDEAKRAVNLAKHGLDLADGGHLFDGRPVFRYDSPRGAELRHVWVGFLGGRLVALVWTRRGGAARLISLRRARDGEGRNYRARYG